MPFVPKTVLDSLDDLPESVDPRDFYVQGEGDYADRYVLNAEAIDGLQLANPGKQARALDKERRTGRSAAKKLADATTEIEDLQAQLQNLKDAAEGGEDGVTAAVEKERARWTAKHEATVTQLQRERDEARSEVQTMQEGIRTRDVESAIKDALTNGEIRGPVRALMPMFKQHARFEDDGSLTILDLDGETPLLKNGEPAGFEELARRYSNDADFADVFRTPAGEGTGRPAEPGSRPTSTRPGRPRQYRATLEEMQDFQRYEELQTAHDKGEIDLVPPTLNPGETG